MLHYQCISHNIYLQTRTSSKRLEYNYNHKVFKSDLKMLAILIHFELCIWQQYIWCDALMEQFCTEASVIYNQGHMNMMKDIHIGPGIHEKAAWKDAALILQYRRI